jgi:hypothetical protein
VNAALASGSVRFLRTGPVSFLLIRLPFDWVFSLWTAPFSPIRNIFFWAAPVQCRCAGHAAASQLMRRNRTNSSGEAEARRAKPEKQIDNDESNLRHSSATKGRVQRKISNDGSKLKEGRL